MNVFKLLAVLWNVYFLAHTHILLWLYFIQQCIFWIFRWRWIIHALGNVSSLFQRRWASAEAKKKNRMKMNLKPGHLVFVVNKNASQNSWLIGRISRSVSDSRGLLLLVAGNTETILFISLIKHLPLKIAKCDGSAFIILLLFVSWSA